MIYHSKGLDLEITDFIYNDDPTDTGEIIPSQTSKYIIRGYVFIMRDVSLAFHEQGESKTANLEELSNNIRDRSEGK